MFFLSVIKYVGILNSLLIIAKSKIRYKMTKGL